MGSDIVSTAVRLERQVLDDLNAAAAERLIGRNFIVNALLRDGLKRLAPLDQLLLPTSTDLARLSVTGDGLVIDGPWSIDSHGVAGGIHAPHGQPRAETLGIVARALGLPIVAHHSGAVRADG